MFHLLSMRAFLKGLVETKTACAIETTLDSVNIELVCYVTKVSWFTVTVDVHESIGGPYMYSAIIPIKYIDSIQVNPIESERDSLLNREDLMDLSTLEE